MSGRTQQYLRSEYIQPPPGPLTLDAKKSPLALLAQTCSAIGKETSAAMNSTTSISTIQPSMCNNKSPTSSPSVSKVSNHDAMSSKSSSKEAPDVRLNRSNSDASKPSSQQNHFSTNSCVKLTSRSPVNVADHYGAIINSKRHSPTFNQSTELKEHHQHSERKVSRHTPPAEHNNNKAVKRYMSHSPKYSKQTSNIKAPESPNNTKEDIKKKRRISHTRSPKHHTAETMSSPARHTTTSTSPAAEKADAHYSKASSTTTIPPPHTSYLMGGKTPPLGHKQPLGYPSMLSCTDRFCVGCQIPHVGGCDVNGHKNAQAQNFLSLYSGLDPMASNLGLAANGVPSSYALQSQFMLAALAARNEIPSAYDTSTSLHMCNWVTAAEGTCGKRFNTSDELIEHLRTHAVPSASSADYGTANTYAAVGANSFAAYLNHPGLTFPGAGAGISASSHLASVALANERLIQSNQRRNNPLYRYHPFKASAAVAQAHANSYLPLMPPSTATSTLYPLSSPYPFYGQPVVAPSSGYVYP